ncbi:lactococcin 972 family bacteriocin [Streptomyces coeruleorubidus]|uniref:lactococcin 972 family bacteriocin n=1 Tax=Streptomyces coeruleorubidus TaxID=116188 RepID=UPI0038242D00
MKLLGKPLTFAAATAALAAGILAPATPASAETPQPEEWGMVAIEVDPSSPVTVKEVELVGGGTWSYGSELTAKGKRCWSHYFHANRKHSATAKIGGFENKATASAGNTAKASEEWGAAYKCYAYWGKE